MILYVMIISFPGIGSMKWEDLESSYKREEYCNDPVKWGEEKLGEYYWSWQRKMMYAVRDYRLNAFYSCHRVGKSSGMGRIAHWWIDTNEPGEALVITTSHSAMQVKMALWREMSRVHTKGNLPGRMNQTELVLTIGNKEEIVAFGRKPADDDTTSFHGMYSKRVLVLGDEACYLHGGLLRGLRTLVSNEHSRIVLFGNPDDPTTEFAKLCKPGSGWNVLRCGYLDTPNFIHDPNYNDADKSEEDLLIDLNCPPDVKEMLISPTWVEEMRKEWGEESPYFISKVKGLYPENKTDGLIPMQWIQKATERNVKECKLLEPVELGLDVGGGVNKNSLALRRGDIAEVIYQDNEPDTMKTLSMLLSKIEETNASIAKVDYIGIGQGIVDRAKEMVNDPRIKAETPLLWSRAKRIVGVKVSWKSNEPEKYINLRAEGYIGVLRRRFESGNIYLVGKYVDKVLSQLSSLWTKNISGRQAVASKEELRAKKIASPDEADSIMLAFIDIKNDEEEEYYTW